MTLAGSPLADAEFLPTWWHSAFPGEANVSPRLLATRLVTAFALGLIVAGIYRSTAAPAKRTRSFVATLVLLSILIALVTQVVGNNAARAFTLVGALSIVRFRTVVQDTRDTAFVIFAVVVGMAVGGDQIMLTLIGIAVCGVAAWMLRSRRQPTPHHSASAEHWVLTIRLAATTSPETIREALAQWFPRCELASSATVKKGVCMQLRYEVFPRSDLSILDCIAAMKALPGVQSVKLDRQ